MTDRLMAVLSDNSSSLEQIIEELTWLSKDDEIKLTRDVLLSLLRAILKRFS